MKARQLIWWALGGVFLLFCVGFVGAVYRFGWSATGFLNKSLWDWLQLLIVPLVLAVVALVFQLANSRTERQIALDKQQEDLLQTYLDRMSELLLRDGLHQSKPGDEVRNVARVRTTTVLTQLDARRIGYVFAFLHEAGLMSTTPNGNVVSLNQANFHAVNWSRANLRGADLSEANLSEANLRGADLSFADLSEANLRGAKLSGATLRGAVLGFADLSKATLSGAKLSEADLRGAKLSGARLSKAHLRGADLSNADLKGATGITIEELEKQAKSLRDVTLHDGSKHT